ncbi:hypothetical protein D6777_03200 [Candidatus Woesearchaeota archaeon]|nr:MAG: hypothetical protein D6777_03200 [Candidatus Woesearchaeota archaeon]
MNFQNMYRAKIDKKFLDMEDFVRNVEGNLDKVFVYATLAINPSYNLEECLSNLENEFPRLKGVVNEDSQVIHIYGCLKDFDDLAKKDYVEQIARRGLY